MNWFSRTALSVAACALVLLSACSDGTTPTATLQPEDVVALQAKNAGGPDLSKLAEFSSRVPTIDIAAAAVWIGPEGGRLEHRGFAIDVPPGAVDRATRFSVMLPVDPFGSERVVAKFSPHGRSFAVPVTIEFPLAETSIDGNPNAHVVWWDGAEWVNVGGAPTEDGARLRTTTGHFSTYGTTAEESALGGSASGAGG